MANDTRERGLLVYHYVLI